LNRALAKRQAAIIDDALKHAGTGATGIDQAPRLAN
jgi:hypothetical protein